MVKSTIPDSRQFNVSIKNSFKSRWFPVLILFPLAVYGIYLTSERRLVTFVMSLFPIESDKSVGFYKDFLKLVFGEMLWITGFVMLAWLIVAYIPLNKLVKSMEEKFFARQRLFTFLIVLISFMASLYVAFNTLETFANSSDEYTYLFQAKTLGDGKLWESAHAFPDFFYFNHIAEKDGIRVGRFPPGWPLLLSVSYYFDFSPALINPVLGLFTLLLFYRFSRKFYGEQVAFWSLIVMAFSSFFVFNSASFFSHTSCALFSVGFVYSLYTYLDNRKIAYALLCGFLLGMIAITRYYTAALMFLPFILFLFYEYRLKAIPMFVWIGFGALPCLAFLLWYNYSITGSPWLPVTMWAYQDEALGFVRGHTVIKGAEHLVRWTCLLLYWTSPALLILYVAALIKKIKSPTDRVSRPEDYFYILLMAGYFFYYQIGGNQYGPRFFFEAFPFLVVFVVNYVFTIRKKWAVAVLIAGLVFAIVKFPSISSREHRIVEERKDVYQIVEDKKISNAIVFVSSHTGIIRPMPIGDLTRNDVDYKNNVIYAQDLGAKNMSLMKHYPGRKFYRYEKEREVVHGKLVPIQ